MCGNTSLFKSFIQIIKIDTLSYSDVCGFYGNTVLKVIIWTVKTLNINVVCGLWKDNK